MMIIIDIDSPDSLYLLVGLWSKIEAERRIDNNISPFWQFFSGVQHDVMTGLIDEITASISDYGISLGLSSDLLVYEALAWSGLQGTDSWGSLEEDEQQTFNYLIEYEGTGFEILAHGTPCN